MSFFELQFPTNISIGAHGGPEFATDIVTVNSGFESRNQRWSVPRLKYDVSHAVRTIAEMKQLVAFFRMVKGRAHGFRFKDFADYTVLTTEGRLGKNITNSVPSSTMTGEKVYKLFKTYDFSTNFTDREIKKPIASTFKLYVNSVQTTAYSLDSTTGIVTLNPSLATDTTLTYTSFSIAGINRSGTTTINTTVAHNLLVGQRVMFSGITGTTELNNVYGTITSVASTSFVVSINSSTYTAWTSGGTIHRYPITIEATPTVNWAAHGYSAAQTVFLTSVSAGGWTSLLGLSHTIGTVNTNAFTITTSSIGQSAITTNAVFSKYGTYGVTPISWSGEFDVPCRFDTDHMNASIESSIHGSWDTIPIIEIRQ
jgi:uncharacterized protein (TIGR02217 family)